jgi:hypothetical protein
MKRAKRRRWRRGKTVFSPSYHLFSSEEKGKEALEEMLHVESILSTLFHMC